MFEVILYYLQYSRYRLVETEDKEAHQYVCEAADQNFFSTSIFSICLLFWIEAKCSQYLIRSFEYCFAVLFDVPRVIFNNSDVLYWFFYFADWFFRGFVSIFWRILLAPQHNMVFEKYELIIVDTIVLSLGSLIQVYDELFRFLNVIVIL